MQFLLSIPRQVAGSFTHMSAKQHFLYWMLPLFLMLATIFMYYAGTGFTEELVAPAINREFGLLENLQNVVLLLIMFYLLRLAITANGVQMKLLFFAGFLFSVFIFLEEIDYGLHWIEHFSNTPEQEKLVVRNFHNQGKGGGYLKFAANVFIGAVFVVFPYIRFRKNSFLRQFSPSKRLLFTVLTILIITNVAHYFSASSHFTNGALISNYSEFEETAIYYLFLLYLMELKTREKAIGQLQIIHQNLQ